MTAHGPTDTGHPLREREVDPSRATTLKVLSKGALTVHGRIAGSSNITLLVTCALDDNQVQAIYKPARGERRLWDFPIGLHRREVAAYVLSETLGFGLVPPTVERRDGPFGVGSLQLLVDEDGVSHYFTLREDVRWSEDLRTLAVFDVVANNADRKSGHVLLAEGRLWAIDNGLSFHSEPKLRTVIWDFAGEALSAAHLDALKKLIDSPLPTTLTALLERGEPEALKDRATRILAEGRLPVPGEDDWRPYPWPLV
ncbi:MAG: SCO1664 family protein [Acidimicrobiales bacterium]